MAVRRLADLSESVDDLRKVAEVLDGRLASGAALSARAWDDAWEAAGWLITRADTSRDAAARALWPPPPERARAAFEGFHDQLADLMKAYLAARASVERRLKAQKPPPPIPAAAALEERGSRGRRLPMVPALIGAVTAVVVVAAGLAFIGGRVPEMAILGGQATPEQTGSASGSLGGPQASPASPIPGDPEALGPSMRAEHDFDMLRVGALDGASSAIAEVVGVNEVVPFPSPFDRSVRMVGSGPHRFCISIPGLEDREVSVAVDLYSVSVPFGALELAAMPSGGPGTATGIPPELLTSLLPGRWYHLNARWQSGMPATIEIRDDQGVELIGELAPASVAAPPVAIEGLCVSASGMASDGELMLDNLRVEQ